MMWRTSFVLLLMALPVLAQESGTGSTQTGSLLPSEDEQVWLNRAERADGFRLNMLQARDGEEAFASATQSYWRDGEERALQCKKSLRKANKLTLFPSKMRCFRTDLLAEHAYRKAQEERTTVTVGIGEERRMDALERITALKDAIIAVQEGIDLDVYASEEELLEAKHNLHTLYRVPAELALIQVNAERNRTWAAHILLRLREIPGEGTLSDEATTALEEIMQCWEEAETLLETTLHIHEYAAAFAAWQTATKAVDTCIERMEKANELF